jgi:hypothetical protein
MSFLLKFYISQAGGIEKFVGNLILDMEDPVKFLKSFVKENIEGYSVHKNPKHRINPEAIEGRLEP